jgi:predicted nucleic acid-binding protein
MLLCDSGVLIAAGNKDDEFYQPCLDLLRRTKGPIPVPSPVLSEAG